MKLLYIGSVIRTEDCTKNIGPSVAGNKMQIGLIKGLIKYFLENVSILTERPIAAFPREKTIYIKGGNIELKEKIFATKVPFINIFILKQLSLIINAFLLIKKWVKKYKREEKAIICYNAYPYIALPVLWAAKLFNIKVICILADPPLDGIKHGILGRVAKVIEDRSTKRSIRKFDGLIVLNENAIIEYAQDSKYIVVDGGFEIEDTPNTPCGGQWIDHSNEDAPLKVIFSGAIIEYNGVLNLIEAAKLVRNPRFRLEIYGSGPLVSYIEKESKEDKRINYMGIVPNTEMMKIQRQAALLVNPRPTNDPISKVTFPSKMIEYLISGTPVVTTKLNGFTEDYLKHMFIFLDETPQAMADTIDDILSRDPNDLIKKSTDAREFIKEYKNWGVQSKKIIGFIETIIYSNNFCE